jgi:4'-phosphopantetheinyl transferase
MPGGAGAAMTLAGGHPVLWWPGRPDVREGPLVIGVDGGAGNWGTRLRGYDRQAGGAAAGDGAAATGRVDARARIRVALREALGELAGLPPEAVMIQSTAGCAPAVSYLRPAATLPRISISHDEPLSLAAIHLHGPVGIDVARVQDIPDWRAVAHDYLGPHAARLLDAELPEHRAAAFARAWSAHEARLKCHRLQLAEWTPRLADVLASCHCRALSLPAGFAGAVAWRLK